MKCIKCNFKFKKSENYVYRIGGTKITVCPECGNEERYDKDIAKIKLDK